MNVLDPNSPLQKVNIDQTGTSDQQADTTDQATRTDDIKAKTLGALATSRTAIIGLSAKQAEKIRQSNPRMASLIGRMERFGDIVSTYLRKVKETTGSAAKKAETFVTKQAGNVARHAEAAADRMGGLANRSIRYMNPRERTPSVKSEQPTQSASPETEGIEEPLEITETKGIKEIKEESLEKFRALSNEQKLGLISGLFDHIKTKGLQEGIFRESGGQDSTILFLRNVIDQAEAKQQVKIEAKNPNEVATVLKNLYGDIVLFEGRRDELSTLNRQLRDPEKGLESVKAFIKKLSPENQEFLSALVTGLAPVVDNPETKMIPSNIAIVFGPTMVLPDAAKPINDLKNFKDCGNILAFILQNRAKIY